VQHELQLSYSSHLARMARRYDMSEWEAILADLTNGVRLSRSVESSNRCDPAKEVQQTRKVRMQRHQCNNDLRSIGSH
jgi:hypothetical protein